MNLARRGFVQALAGIAAGGKSVANTIGRTMAEASPFAASAVGVGLQTVAPTPTGYAPSAVYSVLERAFNAANSDRRRLYINGIPVHVPAHLAGLKSLPLHTLQRMAVEHELASMGALEAMARNLGITREQMPWHMQQMLNLRDGAA